MKITAGLGSVDDYPMYVEAGADECFCGYVPFAWAEKYGVLNPLNRREVRAYNVQIGSYEELKILGNMRKYYQVPVAITFNSLSYTPLCQVHDKKIFIFSCPHVPAFLIGILPPPVSVRRQKTHEVAPFLPAAYTQKLCRLFCNKTQSA